MGLGNRGRRLVEGAVGGARGGVVLPSRALPPPAGAAGNTRPAPGTPVIPTGPGTPRPCCRKQSSRQYNRPTPDLSAKRV